MNGRSDDLIAWIFLHLPPEHRAVVVAGALRALAPGGLLVLECFSPAQHGRRSGGPREPALLWTRTLGRGPLERALGAVAGRTSGAGARGRLDREPAAEPVP